MIELYVQQGTREWLNARAKCFTASEAPAMKGVSSYMSRSELIRQKATGIVPEPDAATLARFKAGHEAEASARPIVELFVGEQLFPIVATDDSGKYLASSDGATMLIDTGFEHKLWNESLAAEVRNGNVPESHAWQLDHQFLVFGFSRILFVVSDGTAENMVYCWYYPQRERIESLVSGWDQFEKDVAAYIPEEVKPKAEGVAPDALPALRIEVTGMVTASNLDQFKTTALAVFRGINTSLQTDQDFADAEKAVKFCKDAEERLEAAKSHALSQTESIDDLFKTIDQVKEEARTVRLKLDKLVKAEKENRKAELVAKTKSDFGRHLVTLIDRVGDGMAHMITPNFAGEIAGLKSLDSMRDKLSVALANAKVDANAMADRIDTNRKTVDDMTLFPDFPQVCTKAPDDFAALMAMRISQRKEAEERKAAQESAAKEALTKLPEIKPESPPALESVAVTKPANETPVDTSKTIKLGEICGRLGFTLTADFLASLGFRPVATDKSAKLYAEASFPAICRALQRHINDVATGTVRLAA